MTVSLKKGQGVSLKKETYDLSQVTIGLGWDVRSTDKKGFFQSLFGNRNDDDFDLDAVAFLCGSDGKVHDLGHYVDGRPTLKNSDIIFFNNLKHPSEQIWLTGDNRTGEGEGDDEQIICNLNHLPNHYHKIALIVQIYKGRERKQTFGQIENAFIRAIDRHGKEMVRFDLSGDENAYAGAHSVLFAELLREADGWRFQSIGTPYATDSFVDILKQYYL